MSAPIRTILLAEDEPVTRRVMQNVLVEMGFAVRPARDGDEGRALLTELQDDLPELLITDIDMPGCGGEELARHARQHCGQMRLLFTSGTPQPALLKDIAGDVRAGFLGKPFLATELLTAIRALGAA